MPIWTREGRFTFGEGDQVVEYVVKMRRLSERHKLLERGALLPSDLDRIAVALKEFYLSQHRLRISTDENFRQTKPFVGASSVFSPSAAERAGVRGPSECPGDTTISRPAFETIRFYTDQFYKRHANLFESRVREKWIRDCHGDLHLEHIHLTPRTLHIYDCIEFNDRFRYVDVANDAAFLAMDLDYEGRPDFARYFARRMAAELGDDEMPLLMDFYKCYRAFVRGKVESLYSVAHASPEEERRAAAERARRYFRLALQYTVAGSKPLVLALMGRIASGKSTLANALGAELGWEVYSADYVRKKIAGFPLYERSSAAARKRLYSTAMTEKTYDQLLATAEAQHQKGHRRSPRTALAHPTGGDGLWLE